MDSIKTASGNIGFEKLMPYRIRDILLVSSLYDSFILEQDGHLTEMLLTEYAVLNLTYAPTVTRASSGAEALSRLQERQFDLVVTMTRLSDMEVEDFGASVKSMHPEIPVVLLVYNTRELWKPGEERNKIPNIDRVFAWRGDVRILFGVIKCVEDRMNVKHDTGLVDVRTILLIEDSIRYYSSFLPTLYSEIMRQTSDLIAEGIDLSARLMRMRARPKILLAETFEEAWDLYEQFQGNMLGVITDAAFAREGNKDDRAGVEFARRILEEDPSLPLVMQSSNARRAQEAHELGIEFIHKESPTLLQDLRGFLKNRLGFGPFHFLLPDGTRVGEAEDLLSMEKQLRKVPPESLSFHASHNQFSNWFMARTEFSLASKIRQRTVSEFQDVESMRQYLIDTLNDYREKETRGKVADFRRGHFDPSRNFMRIGTGSLGGKGRGLAFVNALFSESDLKRQFPGLQLRVPPSAVIGTDVFDSFMEENNLFEVALGVHEDETIAGAFLRARFPEEAYQSIRNYLENVDYPLAVRSSSLLEDSQHQPFAGIYTSHMIPNNHPDDSLRLKQLLHAVKLVYASTFFQAAKSYISSTQNRIEEEKMAVILQQVVGRSYGDHLYPGLAGVAQSHNYYPIHGIRQEDGAASVVLGLGRAVVDGEPSLWFSPEHPRLLPQFPGPKEFLQYSQREFWALDLAQSEIYATPGGEAGLVKLGLDRAEQDGTLWPLGSTYSADNDAVYDGISRTGVRLVTFAHILKSQWFPLPEILKEVLDIGTHGMGAPIEVEFAANPEPLPDEEPEFALLQIRPLVVGREEVQVERDSFPQEEILLYSENALGNGLDESIRDIVYVRPGAFDRSLTGNVARDIRDMNRKLSQSGRHYLLIGPGRWGSQDPWLGIPVAWSDISWARAIVETELEDIVVEPSRGSHFFHNMTSNEVSYFTAHAGLPSLHLDRAWLDAQPAEEESELLRHVRLAGSLRVLLDGRRGHGVVLKPE
jgi:hypothetical protein